MARLLMAALRRAGHDVVVASRFRTRDGAGDTNRQERLSALGDRLAERLLRRYKTGGWRPEVWFTYHLYYKAPDLIGPRVARELNIPYVVAEASHAPKRAGGPWDPGHRAVATALGQADLVIGLNNHDRACVEPVLGPGGRYVQIRPFLDLNELPRESVDHDRIAKSLGLSKAHPWLLAVGMMRKGDKASSYAILADALTRLPKGGDWQLIVVGDGSERAAIEALFEPFFDRTVFTGALATKPLFDIYGAADLLVWPAINEAYGMALLEAQASGLPVVAGDTGGVPDIVRHGRTGLLTPSGDAPAFAAAVASLLADSDRRLAMAEEAGAVTAAEHSLQSAAHAIDEALVSIVSGRGDGRA